MTDDAPSWFAVKVGHKWTVYKWQQGAQFHGLSGGEAKQLVNLLSSREAMVEAIGFILDMFAKLPKGYFEDLPEEQRKGMTYAYLSLGLAQAQAEATEGTPGSEHK